jgi:hypothetical protein
MNFGLFYYCQGRGVPHDQAYAEMLDQISFGHLSHTQVCRSLERFVQAAIRPRQGMATPRGERV